MLCAMGEVARTAIATGGIAAFLGVQIAAIAVIGARKCGSLRQWWLS